MLNAENLSPGLFLFFFYKSQAQFIHQFFHVWILLDTSPYAKVFTCIAQLNLFAQFAL